tara:strand:+ start:272 stop:577 length:306 start_codon:yes stop_codon:yes gene_type:complete
MHENPLYWAEKYLKLEAKIADLKCWRDMYSKANDKKRKRMERLEASNMWLRDTMREALNSNYYTARMDKEPPAVWTYGINARRLWDMKEALEESNDDCHGE